MKCTTYELKTLGDYKYVVTFARFKKQWVLCKHKDRDTWEISGGHIEENETPEEAARRELIEETGAAEFELKAICDYWACTEPHEEKEHGWANGVLFLAEIKSMQDLPDFEMEKIKFFDSLPENLIDYTYPDIYRELIPKAVKALRQQDFGVGDVDLSISQIMDMQCKLHERAGWGEFLPKDGRNHFFWMMEELGEVASVIKKHGDMAIMENPEVRANLIEEVSDIFVYLANMLLCYEVSSHEWSKSIMDKHEKNMKRDWPTH